MKHAEEILESPDGMSTPLTTSAARTPIAILPPEIASQIAAGEVVERPASVVKELVENSLDAGATWVDILLEDGGRELVQVSDDGAGMSPDQALLAVERHATSKISSADDLFRISSYGFRGEALPSIASVSEFELTSRRAEDTEATRVLIRGGILVRQEPAGAPCGTSIRVARLFENVPARRKFLKSSQTELQRGLDFVQRLALAHPEVSFSLRHAEQESFSHPGGDTLAALVSVFGRQVARELIPVEVESHMTLRAYLAPPTRTRPNRTQQFLFVNGRPISSRTLSHAVDEAYSGVLSHGRFPIVVLLLDVPPDMVDVNVHPRKAEVKFVREHDAHSLVFHSLRDALVGKGLVPRVSPSPMGPQPLQPIPAFSFDPPARLLSAHEGHGIRARPFRLPPTPHSPAPGSSHAESSHIADQSTTRRRSACSDRSRNTYIC